MKTLYNNDKQVAKSTKEATGISDNQKNNQIATLGQVSTLTLGRSFYGHEPGRTSWSVKE